MKNNKSLSKFDPLTILIKESEAYEGLDKIERLVEVGQDLSNLPVQPLYLILRKLPVNQVAEYLPRFSKEQREVFLDIDLWKKDDIDIEHFAFWLDAYTLCSDEKIKTDFVTSEQFLLFLKGRFNIWTFDVEDPMYPEHDNYFLTEDNQLLLEFEDNFHQIEEVRSLIRHLYSIYGVEQAYTFLFKLVSDSFSVLQEEEFQARKERLRDFGFVDYMDALEVENPFANLDVLNLFIKNKNEVTGSLDHISKTQILHNSALTAFKDKFEEVTNELGKLEDPKRVDYLQFNFVRLINARLEVTDALKKGSLAMSKAGGHTKALILLGVSYIKNSGLLNSIPEEGLFKLFSFNEIYRIGNSLIKFNLKDIKKALTQHGFEHEVETFLGDYWSDFLDNSFEANPKFHATGKDSADLIVDYDNYQLWVYRTRTLVSLLPFAKKFYDMLKSLKDEGRLQDSYYLNYAVEEINFETLLLSHFANFYIAKINGNSETVTNGKLGLTLEEFKAFYRAMVPETSGQFTVTPEIYKIISSFTKTFGLDQVYDFNTYLQGLLKSQLEGYEIEEMQDEDFQHIGGPIILTIKAH